MPYNVGYKKSVHLDLKRLSKAEVARILDKIEQQLSARPEANPVLKSRYAGLRKLRIGDYRVIYALLGNDVLVLRIGRRRDVYKSEIRRG